MTFIEHPSRKIVGQNRDKTNIDVQIELIEKEVRETPYHKGTERHIGILRARLAKLKDKSLESGSKKSGGGVGYAVKQQGNATIVLVGPPSVGKSTLLNKLTNARSKVAPYAFTTVTVIPGMMEYKDAKIQILDVPGLIRGAEEGKGRGREVLSVIRGSDLLIIMTELNDIQAFERIPKILEKNGVRINKEPPRVIIDKKMGGGLIIHSNIRQGVSDETIKEVATEMGIKNAEIKINEKVEIDRLIDAFSRNIVYIPSLFVINKIDQKRNELHPTGAIVSTPFPYHAVSAEKAIGLTELKEKIWNALGFVRIYLVRSDDEPNFNDPMIMKRGQSLYDVAKLIGTEFAQDKKSAKIWGSSAKFPGQEVSLNTKVSDGLQVRFI